MFVKWFLISTHALIMFFVSSALAGTVKAVSEQRVTIQLDNNEEIIKFDYYYLLNTDGQRRGLILISEVVDDEAWGSIKKGTAEKGWTLEYRGPHRKPKKIKKPHPTDTLTI